jgi:signal transduction histidine kinase
MSIELVGLHELPVVLDTALDFCLKLTSSEFGFVGLMAEPDRMDVAAIKGFTPADPRFYERYHMIPVHPNVFGSVIIEGKPNVSNDVPNDPKSRGRPGGHPPVDTFLGVPLNLRGEVIGMLGVANRPGGYRAEDTRLLETFANQVAVAIANARMYEQQRAMIAQLQELHEKLDHARGQQLLADERKRIARELHDRVQQTLFALGLKLASLEDDPTLLANGMLPELRTLTAGAADQVKEAVFALSQSDLQAGGLVTELSRIVREVQRSGIASDLLTTGRPRELSTEVEQVLFAAAREALTNVCRHAQASSVIVGLHFQDDSVSLVVQDDGVGVPNLILQHYAHGTTHLGLRSMERRIREAGGGFLLLNGEDGGTVVKATIPLSPPPAE